MGGNVLEWNETAIGGSRVIRGGAWDGSETDLRSTAKGSGFPTGESSSIGFRLAAVIPEPSQILLIVTGALGMALKRGRDESSIE